MFINIGYKNRNYFKEKNGEKKTKKSKKKIKEFLCFIFKLLSFVLLLFSDPHWHIWSHRSKANKKYVIVFSLNEPMNHNWYKLSFLSNIFSKCMAWIVYLPDSMEACECGGCLPLNSVRVPGGLHISLEAFEVCRFLTWELCAVLWRTGRSWRELGESGLCQ